MTTITIERELLDQVLAVLPKSSCAIGYESETEWLNVNSKIRAALAAPESGAMAEIDYTDDDALRFIQRVLESDAPGADKKAARDMVVEIRTRVLKARASKPATAPDRHAQELLAQDITIANMRERHAQELCAYEVTVDKLRAERKPMTPKQIYQICPELCNDEAIVEFARRIELHHGIGDKP